MQGFVRLRYLVAYTELQVWEETLERVMMPSFHGCRRLGEEMANSTVRMISLHFLALR